MVFGHPILTKDHIWPLVRAKDMAVEVCIAEAKRIGNIYAKALLFRTGGHLGT